MIDTARAGVRTAGFAARAARRALRAGRAGATRDFPPWPWRPARSRASSSAVGRVVGGVVVGLCERADEEDRGPGRRRPGGAHMDERSNGRPRGRGGRGVALTAARDDKHHRFTPHPTASQTRHASLDRKRLLYVYRTSSVIVYYGACYVRPGLSNEFDGQGERFPV